MKKLLDNVPINFVKNRIHKEVIEEVLNKRYEDEEIDDIVHYLNSLSYGRISKIFRLVINGQFRVISEGLQRGEDVKVECIGSFKKRRNSKLSKLFEKEVINKLGISKEDYSNDKEIEKKVKLEVSKMISEFKNKFGNESGSPYTITDCSLDMLKKL